MNNTDAFNLIERNVFPVVRISVCNRMSKTWKLLDTDFYRESEIVKDKHSASCRVSVAFRFRDRKNIRANISSSALLAPDANLISENMRGTRIIKLALSVKSSSPKIPKYLYQVKVYTQNNELVDELSAHGHQYLGRLKRWFICEMKK